MGQKINPVGFRVGTFVNWKSRWFADDRKFKDLLFEDIKIRQSLMDRFKTAGIDMVEIERLPKSMVITLTVARPGVVIGRGGSGLEEVKRYVLEEIAYARSKSIKELDKELKIDLRVSEVKNAELSAHLVASRIVSDLERRFPHRRVVQKTIERVMQSGALGIKIVLSGRINGAEISRREKYHQGSVPAQTMRENIDYAEIPALLKKGYVGVKVYIHKKAEE